MKKSKRARQLEPATVCQTTPWSDEIISLVQSFGEDGRFLYAGIDKAWLAGYLAEAQRRRGEQHVHETRRSYMFASALTLEVAEGRLLDFKGRDAKAKQLQCCAGKYADIPILEVLAEAPYKLLFTDTVAKGAALSGDVEKLKWIYNLNPDAHTSLVVDAAAASGHVNVLKFFSTIDTFAFGNLLKVASSHGQLKVCQYLVEEGYTSGNYVCWEAARRGHLDILRYLHESKCVFKIGELLKLAARFGHVNILDYLLEQDANVVDSDGKAKVLINLAGKNGKLNVLNWVIQQRQIQWPATLTGWKAECITWATDHGWTPAD